MMEFLVTNNLNVYFLNVLLMNHFDRLIVNQDKLLKFDINVVQLQIHVQKRAIERERIKNKSRFSIKHTSAISLNELLKFFLDKFFSVNEI